MIKKKQSNLLKRTENGLLVWGVNKFILFFLIVNCTLPSSEKTKKIELNNLKHGLLICRLGNGYFSNYFRKFASKEKIYSHIGILSKENNKFYVYHADASEFSGVGQVKRDAIEDFLKDIKVYDYFELKYDSKTRKAIVDTVKEYFNKETPFDLNFDSTNDNELYCSELIATSINSVLDQKEILPTIIVNGNRLYGLDDIYLNKNIIRIKKE